MRHQLKGLYGIAYSCSNSSNKNSLLSEKSLQSVKSLGFNHIRNYFLDPNKDHSEFLTLCCQLNLSIEIGIANHLLENRDVKNIQKLINSVKKYKCITIYTVGNEYFGDINNIIFAIELIYSLDCNKYIMHSSIFDNQFTTAKKIYSKIPNYIVQKYIVGINIYFYNNAANTHGDLIQNVINEYYLDSILQNSYLIISEFGNNKTEDQWNSLWNFSWGNSECIKKYPKYLGYSLFSFSNENWKAVHNGENNYGIVNEDGKPKDGYYAIREFKKTDNYKNTIKKNLYYQ